MAPEFEYNSILSDMCKTEHVKRATEMSPVAGVPERIKKILCRGKTRGLTSYRELLPLISHPSFNNQEHKTLGEVLNKYMRDFRWNLRIRAVELSVAASFTVIV